RCCLLCASPASSDLYTLSLYDALPILSDEAIRAVASRTFPRTLRRNAQLFREGDPCHGLDIVVEGKVQVYRASPDGREQVLHVEDRKSTRLNSSHVKISYAVCCVKNQR